MDGGRGVLGAGLFVSFICSACSGQSNQVSDPIQGFPAAQQQTITRGGVDKNWPLTVGRGTLGCLSGAVVFRFNGASYAVNDAARAQGFASIEPLLEVQPSRGPSNPLGRLTQDVRMQIFAESAACEARGGSEQHECIRGIRARHRLSEADLKQIMDEGRERSWAPLRREKADLKPLVDRGLKLCRP